MLVAIALLQMRLQLGKGCRIREIAGEIRHRCRKLSPRLLVDRAGFEFPAPRPGGLFEKIVQRSGPGLAVGRVVIDADQRKGMRQQTGFRKIVESRNDQPFRQVAAGAENHHRAWWRRRAVHDFFSVRAAFSSCPSTCPPNCARSAESSLSPNPSVMRERKRA